MTAIMGGLLMIVTGLTIMTFGLFLFYAFLPLLFGLVGFDIGVLLGRWLTGNVGFLAIALGFICAAMLAIASYSLEPLRRTLIGVSGGFLFGMSLAAAFGLDGGLGGFLGILLGLVCAVIGGVVVPYLFDHFIIGTSAFGGASLVVSGAHLVLPSSRWFDHVSSGLWSTLIILALAVVGVVWQLRNISTWAPTMGELSRASAGHDKSPRR